MASIVSITITHILYETSVTVTVVNRWLMRNVTSPSPATRTSSQCANAATTIAIITCSHVQQCRRGRRGVLQSRLQQQACLCTRHNKPEQTSDVKSITLGH